jgi:hypothetical protein
MSSPLKPLIDEWKAKTMYNLELFELLELGELTPAMAHFIDVRCKQLFARCQAIEKIVAKVKTVADERPGRLDISFYAMHPPLLPRVSRCNELAEVLDQLQSVIVLIAETSAVDVELAIHERYAAISQELDYQFAMLKHEIENMPEDGGDDWQDDDDDLLGDDHE